MKIVSISFLFFCLGYNCLGAGIYKISQEMDSLKYYSKMANRPESDSSLTTAFAYFNKELNESKKRNDISSSISHLRQIAIIQNKLGDYFGSEATVVEALKILDHSPVSKRTIKDRIGLLNQLGRINMELLDYEASIRYYDEALGLAESANYRNIIQNNKAVVYIQMKDYALAEKVLTEAYKNSAPLDNIEQTARALDNLGFVQSKLNRSNSLDKLNDALDLRISIGDNAGMYASYKHLSEYYKDRGDLNTALQWSNKGYETAKLVNSPSFIKDALTNLINLGSTDYALEYMHFNDSLNSLKQIQENKYAKIKYDYTQKEKLAKEAELEKEKQRRLKLLYLSLGSIVLILSVFTVFILRTKYKKDKLQEVYMTETRISKKVHDEVANDVYQVMTKLQESVPNKEELLDHLEDIYTRTRDISKENSTLDVNESFDVLLNDLLLQYKNDQVNVITLNLSKINWEHIDSIKKVTIYRVLQELMVNMKKHSQASMVVLSFDRIHKKVNITYTDNGIGCHLKKGTGGLQNVENRMQSINGAITFETETHKGFKATLIV